VATVSPEEAVALVRRQGDAGLGCLNAEALRLVIAQLDNARQAVADELCAELELFDQADSVPGRTDWQRWMFLWEDGPGAAAFIRAYMRGEAPR
jgi:hypothetical protein